MNRSRRSFLTAASTTLALAGCAPFMTWVQQNGPIVDAAITEALSIMDGVERWFTQFFAAHADAAAQAEEIKIVEDVRLVAQGVAKLIAGGIELTQLQIMKAESDFSDAWAAFVAFAAKFGVKVASFSVPHVTKLSDGGLLVPEPAMLHLTKYVKGK